MASKQDVKLAEELKALTKQRVELEKQLAEQKSKMESSEKKSIENIKKLVTLEALRMDSVEKEEEVRKKIQKLDKESEDRQKKSEKHQKETADRNKKEEESEKKKQELQEKRKDIADITNGLAEKQKKSIAETSAKIGLMSDKTKGYTDSLQKANVATSESVEFWNDIGSSIKKGYNTSDAFRSNFDEVKNISSDITGLINESAVQTKEIEKGSAKIVDTDKAREAIAVARYQIEQKGSGLSAADQQTLLKGIELEEQRLDAIEEQNKVIEKQSAKYGMINDVGSKIGDSMSSWVKKLPGGEMIYKTLGIDETANKMNKSFTSAIQNGLKGNFKGAFAEGVKGLGSMIAMGPKLVAGLGLGALAGGFGLLAKGAKGLFNVLMEVDGEIAQMGKDFAMSKNEAGELYKNTARMANEMKITGINTKEIGVGLQAAQEAFGGMDIAGMINAGNKEMEGFVKQASVLTKQFGLSTKEVANLKDLSVITGTSMDNLVKDAVGVGKGVMNAKEAMKTLAGVPKEVAVGFKGSTKELAAAAIKAKMLGTDLKKIKDIGRGMLDLEASMTAEFEAQALTGKNLNLSAARRYALEGDVYNLQEELLNQAGSLEEFSNMNTIQQEAMAKAMGMSVEEMTDMLTNAEKLKDAKIDATMAENLSKMNAQQLAEASKKATNEKQKAYIEELAAQKRSASLQESIADAVEKLKQKFAPVIDAIIDMVGGLEEGGDKVSIFQEMLDSIDMDAIAAGVKEALPKVLEAVKGLIKNLPKIIEMVSGLISKFSGIAGAAGGFLDILGPSAAGLGAMALKVAGPGGIAAGFKVASKGAMGLFDMVKGPLMDGVKGLAGSVSGKLGGAFSSVASKAGKLGGKLGGMASKIGGDKGGGLASKAKMPKAGGGGGMLKGLNNAVKGMDTKKMMQGAAAILILAAALFVTAKAIQEFMKVDWAGMAKAGVALLGLAAIAQLMGSASVNMILGAAAMLVLGAALYVIGAGLQFFTTIKWEDLAKAGVALVAFSAIAVGLGMAAPFILIGSAAMVALGAGAFAFGAGMNEIVRALVELQKLGDLNKVGENLGKGMESLGSISDKVDLSKLEDSFDDLDDALEELDFEQLAAFGQLGNSALKGAGENLVAGINSLMGINKGIDWGGLEDTFDGLEDSLDELDLEGIQAFAKLGEEGIKKAGENLIAGLNSFQGIDPKSVITAVAPLEDVFSALEDAFDELDYEELDAFGKVDFSKMAANTAGLASFAQAIGSISGTPGIDKLEEQFSKLSDAIDDLDIDKLNELGNIKSEAMENFGKLQAVFQPSQKIEGGEAGGGAAAGGAAAGAGGGAAAGGAGGSLSGVESKLDQLIGVISSLATTPAVIKIGERTVEELRLSMDIKKTFNVEKSFGRNV